MDGSIQVGPWAEPSSPPPFLPERATARSVRFRLQLNRGVDHAGLLRFRHRYESPRTYVAMTSAFSVSVHDEEILIRIRPRGSDRKPVDDASSFLHLRFLGARAGAQPVPLDDPDGARASERPWRPISSLYWAEVTPGVDLVLDGDGGGLSFMLVAWLGGDLRAMRLAYRGTEPLTTDGDGGLLLSTAAGTIVQTAPALHRGVAYDPSPSKQRYRILGGSEASLHIKEPELYEGGRL